MKRLGLTVLTILLIGGMHLWAHEDFRVIGTVTKVQATQLDVKMSDGKTVSIAMDKQTNVTRDKSKVGTSTLKSGQSVVVDAYGDNYDSLLAIEVRIVPAIAPASKK
jgi:hypothetical protein